MSIASTLFPGTETRLLPEALADWLLRRGLEGAGLALLALGAALAAALFSHHGGDPSFNVAIAGGAVPIHNWMGLAGALAADLLIQTLGQAGGLLPLLLAGWGLGLLRHRRPRRPLLRVVAALAALSLLAVALAALQPGPGLPGVLPGGLFGLIGLPPLSALVAPLAGIEADHWAGFGALALSLAALALAFGLGPSLVVGALAAAGPGLPRALERAGSAATAVSRLIAERDARRARPDEGDAGEGIGNGPGGSPSAGEGTGEAADSGIADGSPTPRGPLRQLTLPILGSRREDEGRPRTRRGARAAAPERVTAPALPATSLLQDPPPAERARRPDAALLQEIARQLAAVLNDFGIRGEIVGIQPGPVVTLFELEPAPGTKSARVIGLAEDIARQMSAVSVRIAVVPGRNVIGIEIPNPVREIVYLRELLERDPGARTPPRLGLILGKDIAGQTVTADLARMPHLLIAGTTGSGKSVAINTMVLSLLFRLPPERCRLIMVDPKMLELSVYEGIPHLLAPVVTDPKKAIVALKWAVREMEDRYRAMSRLGVRNIESYNARLRQARDSGEIPRVQTGFDEETGEALYEDQPLPLAELPYIVVIVDEFADLMLVAGKDIEWAIQRLAQMARAAGIHLVMATQRPSVDVITGTIKANFPTRISFHVTSKIDSRTILGEGGAEQLLGQGDMLFMAESGRLNRVHGPFVSDEEVERVVRFLRAQGQPDYVEAVTAEEEEADGAAAPMGARDDEGEGGDLFERAVRLVVAERKPSISYVQRRLNIGYNRAAKLIEEMEARGIVTAPSANGKREVIAEAAA